MFTIDPKEMKTSVFHSYMLASIAPRPIAFASTVDKEGNMNLAPFSFFNAFGSKPPTIVFSPARRVRDNTIKHTLENIHDTKEVVINVVNYDMVQQMSLASTEYPKGVSEFVKAGFTPVKSELIRPFRVKESPVQMECKVVEVKEMGQEGGAANLIICEILLMHIDENVLTPENKIDPNKIDLVARMGGDLYCRASGNALFEVAKPNSALGMGIDRLPIDIRTSNILTGNNLGQLGNSERFPDEQSLDEFRRRDFMKELFSKFGHDENTLRNKLHELAKTLLEQRHVEEAWKVLLCLKK
ncbi:MAG: flavin reductase family protein [Bacteroidia bacterium]|nr:flavin reductase family protein [Bacteroidia bacterium]